MLEKIPNTNPFTVPEGYFEQFYATLETKIKQEAEEKRTAVRISFFRKVKPYLMAAAVFGVLFTVLQTAQKPFDKDTKTNVTLVAENANVPITETDVLYSHLMTDEYSFMEYIVNE